MEYPYEKVFDILPRRVIDGLRQVYSDFEPVPCEAVSERSQKRLHDWMRLLLDKLYERPDLLGLAPDADEAYLAHELNNMRPELDKKYRALFKALYAFYQFLYIAALCGRLDQDSLALPAEVLRAHGTVYKPAYGALLSAAGISVHKDRDGIVIQAGAEWLRSLKLLADRVPVNVNPWTPYALVHFACCSFTGDFGYLPARADKAAGTDGILLQLMERCRNEGYTLSIECVLGATDLRYSIIMKKRVGGFLIGYQARKLHPYHFGTLNGIGEKAMLEDFGHLDRALQEYFIRVCRPCSRCMFCAKGGRNQIFTVRVRHDGKDMDLCPSFPQHLWDRLDDDLIDTLFLYHGAQERYGG